MRKIVLFLLKISLCLLAAFSIQKVLFVAINHTLGGSLSVGDWLQVVLHGVRLDVVSTCYVMTVPILMSMVGMFCRNINLRALFSVWFVPISVIVSMAFLGDAILYHYWGAKLDAADFLYAKNPKDMLASLSWGMLAMAVLAIAILSLGLYFVLRIFTPKTFQPIRNKWLAGLALVVIMAMDVVGMRGGLQESTANPSYSYFSNNQFLNHAALNPLFNILHSLSKRENLAEEFCFYSDEEISELTDSLYKSGDDICDTLLNCTSPNVLLLVWEGGGRLFLDNDSVAPGFAELRGEGVFFDNLYANNFRTDRGLVSLLNGWLGLPTTSVMKMSGRCKSLPSLAKSLHSKGYHSAFYYGGDIDFTNMRGYLYETGYDQVYGGDHYAWAPVKSKWGVDDEYFLQTVIDDCPQEPFFATFLTLSSHEPWEVPYNKMKDEKANAFAYTDSCIYQLVQQLRARPIWKNLLLIIVPDHGVAWQGFGPASMEVAKIPMLWLGGAVREPKVVDCLMNQSDIAATLLSQMMIKHDDFIFSRNVLSKDYKPSVVTHAYKNGMNVKRGESCMQFSLVDGNVVANESGYDEEALRLVKAILQRTYQATSKL